MGNMFRSGKEDNLANYTQIFENFSLGISVPVDYLPEISGVFGCRNGSHFPNLQFSENFPGNCTGSPSSLGTVNMTLHNSVIIRVCMGIYRSYGIVQNKGRK